MLPFFWQGDSPKIAEIKSDGPRAPVGKANPKKRQPPLIKVYHKVTNQNHTSVAYRIDYVPQPNF